MAEELKELLDRAVRARLVADVPVGLFVSGGLDSGLVAAIARRAKESLHCFSIGFEESSFDESRYAREIAESLGIKHHIKTFRAKEMAGLVERLPEILDELPYRIPHVCHEGIKWAVHIRTCIISRYSSIVPKTAQPCFQERATRQNRERALDRWRQAEVYSRCGGLARFLA